MTTHVPTHRLAVAGLIVLSLIPVGAGMVRLTELAAGSPLAAEDERFFAAPAPLVLHSVGATLVSLLGALQVDSGLRQAWPRWHRRAGRISVVGGLLAAATGIWMTLRYAIPPDMQGSLLFGVRVVVGGGMALALLLAVQRILEGNLASHRAWMLRAYALGQGAGTQVLFLLPPQLLSGQVTGTLRDVLMTAAWAANVLVAESVIRRAAVRPGTQPAPGQRRLAPPAAVSSPRAGRTEATTPSSLPAAASAASKGTP
ncbi:MAG: DUF2306 domain-containing protein [Acidobacteria bacterium]|nr:DUF2306 domain-containing protein [Acidobacteriota bacterium]